jgi:hypothetical protein
MFKGIATINGMPTIFIGLSFANLDRFRAQPGDTFIKINGKEMALPHDILIFSGETEAHMYEMVKNSISENTIIHIDPKLKS